MNFIRPEFTDTAAEKEFKEEFPLGVEVMVPAPRSFHSTLKTAKIPEDPSIAVGLLDTREAQENFLEQIRLNMA
jgi:hypothetical protein